MPNYYPENVKATRAYAFFLETADGKQAATDQRRPEGN